jgi:hypothetical protein
VNYPAVTQLTLPVSAIWTNPKAVGSHIYAFASANSQNILHIKDNIDFYTVLTYKGRSLTQIGYDKMEGVSDGDRVSVFSSNILDLLNRFSFASVDARAATTANINLSSGGLLAIDGVAVEEGDIVLVKDQTARSENGIYTASSGAWTRHGSFADNSPDCFDYKLFLVTGGAANAGLIFTIQEELYNVGRTNISFLESPFSVTRIAGKIQIAGRASSEISEEPLTAKWTRKGEKRLGKNIWWKRYQGTITAGAATPQRTILETLPDKEFYPLGVYGYWGIINANFQSIGTAGEYVYDTGRFAAGLVNEGGNLSFYTIANVSRTNEPYDVWVEIIMADNEPPVSEPA